MDNVPDHYAALGVQASATGQEIARAYRSLMRTHHPDADGGAAAGAAAGGRGAQDREIHEIELLRIMQAFAVLRDPARRAAYDRSLASRTRRGAGPQDIPVRRVPSEAGPSGRTIRITPVRWESGPWT